MENEIEAKFLAINKEYVREALIKAGFLLKIGEYMMRRKTFDFSNIAPGRNKWGRVRQEADKVTMTIKEIRGSGIDDTYEIELIVNDFDTAVSFFESCEIFEKAFQENLREVWVRKDVEVTIDTWPGLKPFIEIEGKDKQTVQNASTELGFDFNQALFGSIDLVYEKELGIPKDIIIKLKEITFDHPPIKKLHKGVT